VADAWDRLTVVFIVHNSASVVKTALKGLQRAHKIIVIDNASSDGSLEILRQSHKYVEIIHNPDNTGVSWPSNMAFEKVETEFVLHMNPDTRFDGACIEHLVETMDADPNTAVVSPMTINANGDQEIDVMGPGEIHHRKIAVPPEGPFCSWYVVGSVWLWRMAAFHDIGGFDSNIFLYNEDVDICLRAARAGYSLIVDTEAIIHHGGGVSERLSHKTRWRKDWNLTWSHFYLTSKYRGVKVARAEARSKVVKFAGAALLGLLILKPKTVVGQLARMFGAIRFLQGKPSWLRDYWVKPPPY